MILYSQQKQLTAAQVLHCAACVLDLEASYPANRCTCCFGINTQLGSNKLQAEGDNGCAANERRSKEQQEDELLNAQALEFVSSTKIDTTMDLLKAAVRHATSPNLYASCHQWQLF